MERTKNNVDDGKVPYKKKNGGSLWFKGKRIMQNGTFWAHPDEIPDAFKDSIVRADGMEHDVEPAPKVKAAKPSYFLQQRGTSSWYNVVDANDNEINKEGALRRVAALDLIKELEEE